MKLHYRRALSVVVFCSLCQCIVAQSKDNWEFRILRNIEAHRTESKTHFFKAISASVYVFSIGTPATYLIVGSINKDNTLKKTALYFAETVGLTEAINFSIKSISNRQRPAVEDPTFTSVSKARDASFFSGHTSAAFSLATSLALVNPKWYIAVPAFTWASLVGYSRLYLGAHFPTDVFVGAIVGSGVALLSYRMNKWLHQSKKSKITSIPAM